MSEIIYELSEYNPVELFGANEARLNQIRVLFPKVKIIQRGNKLKLIGDRDSLSVFEKRFGNLLTFFDKFGRLSEQDVFNLMDNTIIESATTSKTATDTKDVLVYGRNGKIIKALTTNQVKLVEESSRNDLIFAIGPAGTGKTYTAVALAVKALKNKEVRRIVLTRPAVEAGENLGFLPGDMQEKLDPYLQPLYDALRDMIPSQKLLNYWEDGTIEIAPLAFMRGRTLDHAFVILDEAQNATEMQMKMFLTRMGKSSKFVITGDKTQIDLIRNQKSGLIQVEKILANVKGISFVYLNEKDVVRHPLVSKIIDAYKQNNE
jgi:phosphate starvation-inducible PhoH-like protein